MWPDSTTPAVIEPDLAIFAASDPDEWSQVIDINLNGRL